MLVIFFLFNKQSSLIFIGAIHIRYKDKQYYMNSSPMFVKNTLKKHKNQKYKLNETIQS